MKLPILRAEQTFGRIDVESSSGQYRIQTRQADLRIATTSAQISAPTPQPTLHIDQSRMWRAFNGGKTVEFMSNIYSQMPAVALRSIEKIVQKGNRLGDIRDGQNPIPEMAMQGMLDGAPDIQYLGRPSYDNVDIHFNIPKPDAQIEPGGVDIEARIYKPDIQYQRGGVDVYMIQKPGIRFQVANLDVRV
ncbi:DUF6470 family protein [uncultured Paenibacillus sp.]|uniref:DUF6470 family protein n=1 Tax=uncultured Paenibacillus sp. TaxID=227322 RepID=UPI0028D2B478|nr:DUF6470 family protein [uncultured Paenibacillus sp.]